MDIRLVASDLDGTLLRSDKTISKETTELLYQLDDEGIVFVPSTGRAHTELPDVIRQLSFLRYAITCNGGGVYDYREEKYVFDFAIDKDPAREVLEYCNKLPVYPTIVYSGKRYIQSDETGGAPTFVKEHAAPGIVEGACITENLTNVIETVEGRVHKIMLYPFGNEEKDFVLKELKNRFPSLAITTSGPLFVEVNASGIDKGRTLGLLCEHLNIPIENTIAFGDAANDLAMLKAAGCAVVPENGTDEVKAIADRICPACDEDGFRKTLEDFHLQKVF